MTPTREQLASIERAKRFRVENPRTADAVGLPHVLELLAAALAASPDPPPADLVAHVGCGDIDNMGRCEKCQAIRDALAALPPPADPQLIERLTRERDEARKDYAALVAVVREHVNSMDDVIGLGRFSQSVDPVRLVGAWRDGLLARLHPTVCLDDPPQEAAPMPPIERGDAAQPDAPVHDCETWRLGGLGCARCNKAAAPPADLVAIVREYQETSDEWHALPDECDDDDLVERVGNRLGQLHEKLLAYPLPAAPRVPDTPQGCAATPPPVICCCETCGIRLEEDFGTYVTGVRAGTAWRCAVCLPIEGPSGRLLRDKVVQERRKRASAAAPPQDPPR